MMMWKEMKCSALTVMTAGLEWTDICKDWHTSEVLFFSKTDFWSLEESHLRTKVHFPPSHALSMAMTSPAHTLTKNFTLKVTFPFFSLSMKTATKTAFSPLQNQNKHKSVSHSLFVIYLQNKSEIVKGVINESWTKSRGVKFVLKKHFRVRLYFREIRPSIRSKELLSVSKTSTPESVSIRRNPSQSRPIILPRPLFQGFSINKTTF